MSKIPEPIATAAVAMLAPYRPGLTLEELEAALSVDSEREIHEELMTRREACEALHISMPTLGRMLDDGELERVRIRRRVFVRAADVRAIIEGKEPRKAIEQTETQSAPKAEGASSRPARKQW